MLKDLKSVVRGRREAGTSRSDGPQRHGKGDWVNWGASQVHRLGGIVGLLRFRCLAKHEFTKVPVSLKILVDAGKAPFGGVASPPQHAMHGAH